MHKSCLEISAKNCYTFNNKCSLIFVQTLSCIVLLIFVLNQQYILLSLENMLHSFALKLVPPSKFGYLTLLGKCALSYCSKLLLPQLFTFLIQLSKESLGMPLTLLSKTLLQKCV